MVAPPACDPRLSADVPKMPEAAAGATIVQPVTLDERVATQLHLAWVDELVDVIGVLVERATIAKDGCAARVVGNPPP